MCNGVPFPNTLIPIHAPSPTSTLTSTPTPTPAPTPLSIVIQAIIKPQYVDHIPKAVKGKVGEIFTSKNQLGTMEAVLNEVSVMW